MARTALSSNHFGRRDPRAEQPEQVVTSEIDQPQVLQDLGITGNLERAGSTCAVRMVFTALPVLWKLSESACRN
jgi:hypothetical protein